jgi:hypothetical protein
MMPDIRSSGSGSPLDRLVIYPSRAKTLLVLLGAIGFVALAVWIGTLGLWSLEALIAVCVGVPFFSACALYAMYRLVRNRPVLEIDWMGITDAASAFGAGRLYWSEVDHLLLYKIQGQSMLGIFPRDLDPILRRFGAFQRGSHAVWGSRRLPVRRTRESCLIRNRLQAGGSWR